jgi:hypothetical protein
MSLKELIEVIEALEKEKEKKQLLLSSITNIIPYIINKSDQPLYSNGSRIINIYNNQEGKIIGVNRKNKRYMVEYSGKASNQWIPHYHFILKKDKNLIDKANKNKEQEKEKLCKTNI